MWNFNVKLALALSLLFSINAWSRTSLLGLMKERKHQFSANPNCLKFIQSASSDTLKAPSLQSSLKSLTDVGINGDYFFHYSDDAGSFLQEAVRTQNFKSTFEYLLTYYLAPGNAMGGGMYMAANPFSSAEYGSFQLTFKVDPKAKIFDVTTDSTILNLAIASVANKDPNFVFCDLSIQRTLIYSENDVDMVYYSRVQEWFVALNEEVIMESQINYIASKYPTQIVNKMAVQNNVTALLPLIRLPGSNRTDMIEIELFAEGLQNSGPEGKKTLLKITSNSQGEAFKKFSNYLVSSNTPPRDYFTQDLSQSGAEYKDFIAQLFKYDPSLLAEWDDEAYVRNMSALLKSRKISVQDYLSKRKASSTLLKLYRSRSSFSEDIRKDIINQTLKSAVLDSSLIKAQGFGAEVFSPALNDKAILAELSLEDFQWISSQLGHDLTPQDLKGMWDSGLISFKQALILLKNLKLEHGKENLDRLLKDHLDLSQMSDVEKTALASFYTANHSGLDSYLVNQLWPILLDGSEKNETLSPLRAFTSLSPENKSLFLKGTLDSSVHFEEGNKLFSQVGLVLPTEVILTKNERLISAMTPYLEADYPQKKIMDYVYPFVMNYEELKDFSSARNHMEQFICQKINRYNAFQKLIDQRRSEKAALKVLRTTYCQ